MTDTSSEKRAGYIAGLRALAELLETHPELDVPTSGQSYCPITVSLTLTNDQAQRMARWARALPGTVTKEGDDIYYSLAAQLAGLHVRVTAAREQVCRKVVKGTRTVQRPDPSAPLVDVEVEDVEWVCEPILAQVTR